MQQNAALKERLDILHRNTPEFGKLPQLVTKFAHVPHQRPKLPDLEQCRDMFLTSFTYTMLLLSGNEDAWKRNLDRTNNGFLTHQEDMENFIKETKKHNNRSRQLKRDSKEQPDTIIGPEGIKFLRNALGYHPPPEPSDYPPNYKGTVAVVDGASVLMR